MARVQPTPISTPGANLLTSDQSNTILYICLEQRGDLTVARVIREPSSVI
jgi:hypothetical protein